MVWPGLGLRRKGDPGGCCLNCGFCGMGNALGMKAGQCLCGSGNEGVCRLDCGLGGKDNVQDAAWAVFTRKWKSGCLQIGS